MAISLDYSRDQTEDLFIEYQALTKKLREQESIFTLPLPMKGLGYSGSMLLFFLTIFIVTISPLIEPVIVLIYIPVLWLFLRTISTNAKIEDYRQRLNYLEKKFKELTASSSTNLVNSFNTTRKTENVIKPIGDTQSAEKKLQKNTDSLSIHERLRKTRMELKNSIGRSSASGDGIYIISNNRGETSRCLFCLQRIEGSVYVEFSCCGLFSHLRHLQSWKRNNVCPYCQNETKLNLYLN